MRRKPPGCLCCWLLAVAVLTPPLVGAADRRLSEATHNQLAEVHALMEKERFSEALRRLDGLHAAVKSNPYAHALVLQTYGYLHAARADNAKAIEALARCLALDALPREVSQTVRYLLAQVQIEAGDYRGAAGNLEQWFAANSKPSPTAHALAGTAYAYLKQYPAAEKHLAQALSLSEQAPEDWHRRLLAVYLEMERYQAARRLLERMIAAFPQREDYWAQLSAVHSRLDDDRSALAVLELARMRGLLSEEEDLLGLTARYLHLDLALKAARLLEAALSDGSLSAKRETLELLSDAWLQAKEFARARDALDQAARLAADPEIDLRRAQLAAQEEDWKLVLEATSVALTSGRLRRPGQAHLLVGVASYNLGDLDAAMRAFETAAQYHYTRQDAQQWISFLTSDVSVDQ